jgi:hypothetical protein
LGLGCDGDEMGLGCDGMWWDWKFCGFYALSWTYYINI